MVEPHAGSLLSCSACSRLRCSFLGAITHCTSDQLETTGNPASSDISSMRSIATFCTLSSLVKDQSARRLPEGWTKCGGARIAISKILSMPFVTRGGKILGCLVDAFRARKNTKLCALNLRKQDAPRVRNNASRQAYPHCAKPRARRVKKNEGAGWRPRVSVSALSSFRGESVRAVGLAVAGLATARTLSVRTLTLGTLR